MRTKTTIHLLAVALAALAVTAKAEPGSEAKTNAANPGLRPATAQCGQSGTITYFKPAHREFTVAVYKGTGSRASGELPRLGEPQRHWRSQSVPNGNAVTYLTP